jgi:hypothetical protein
MSIAHELSSDITSALVDTLEREGSTNPVHVAEILRDFQSALSPLENERHIQRARIKARETTMTQESNSRKS